MYIYIYNKTDDDNNTNNDNTLNNNNLHTWRG